MYRKLLLTLSLLLMSFSFAQTTTLRLVEVITSPQRTELLQSLVDRFEAANPGVQVEIISLPWEQSFERLLTMVQGGQAPDLAEMPDKWIALYGAMGQLEPLESYVQAWDNRDELSPRALEAGSLYQGQLLEIPYGFYMRALFYNTEILEQAGAEPPTTLEEFMAVAEATTNASEGTYGYCLRGARGGFDSAFWLMSAQNGSADWFHEDGSSTFTDEGAVQGLQMFADLYQNGWAPPDSVNWGFNEIVGGFYSGTCAMLDQDPDTLGALEGRMSPEQYGVVPMPVGPSGMGFPKIGFAGWSIFESSANKDAAWQLIAFLSSPEVNLE
jgi:multiple sugar transport system substrate-binding protein